MEEGSVVEATDAEIAILMMERDEEGLRLLFRKHGPKVKGWLKQRYRHVLAELETDEALNVAAYKCWKSADSYDERRGSLGGWFLRIAQNAAIDILRQETRQRLKSIEYDPGDDSAGSESGEPDTPDGGPKDSPLREDFRAVVEELPALQKAIIKADLAANGVASAGRLAEIHGTSLNSIYVSRNKARDAIKRKMMARGYFRTGGGQSHGE
jgi:RNA polymerase sigma factor (sigma-70 family)